LIKKNRINLGRKLELRSGVSASRRHDTFDCRKGEAVSPEPVSATERFQPTRQERVEGFYVTVALSKAVLYNAN
jgi:hypothetical protein